MNINNFKTAKGRVISPFHGKSYTTAFKTALVELQLLFKYTLFLPTDASLSERIFCYNNKKKFRPKCNCGKYVSFNINMSGYRTYCSDKCASQDRSSFYSISDETREKISKASIISNSKLNDVRSVQWKQTILDKFPNFDFSKFEWTNQLTHESTVMCNIHGEYETDMKYLLESEYGCYDCGKEAISNNISSTKISKASTIFFEYMNEYRPDQIIDETIYDGDMSPTKIHCSIHGIVETTPSYLMGSEYECSACGKHIGARKSPLDINIIKDFVHTNHSHIKVISDSYTNVYAKDIEIECETHGKSYTNADMIFRSAYCCKKCGRDVHADKKSYSFDQVNEMIQNKHPHIKCLEYTRSGTKDSKFECDKHGVFYHSFALVYGTKYGCIDCVPRNSSEGELQVLEFVKQYTDASKKRPFGFEIDVYIPSKQFGIEYNGDYFHSDVKGRGKDYHSHKTSVCNDNDVFLLHVWEHQWKDVSKREIIKSMIRSKLGVISNKVHARKCDLVDLSTDSKLVQPFLDMNHIQGRTGTQIVYGLMYQNELVSVMTFSYLNNAWHLTRFANKLNTNVNGAFTKLLKHFERANDINEIYTFADLSYSNGNVYKTNGFDIEYQSEPGYFYVHNDKRYHRSSFMKSKIKERFNLTQEEVDSKTETELINQLGILRIWDCGKIKFKKTFK